MKHMLWHMPWYTNTRWISIFSTAPILPRLIARIVIIFYWIHQAYATPILFCSLLISAMSWFSFFNYTTRIRHLTNSFDYSERMNVVNDMSFSWGVDLFFHASECCISSAIHICLRFTSETDIRYENAAEYFNLLQITLFFYYAV